MTINDTQRRDLYLGMLFKIAFLKSMLSIMTEDDLMLYYGACSAIFKGNMEEQDVEAIDTLFKKFEHEAVPDANSFSKNQER